jgi:hypothetical protein
VELVAAVKAAPDQVEPWLSFLEHERGAAAARGAAGRVGKGEVTLFRMFEWATKTIPRSGNSKRRDYLRVWLGYAAEQACAPLSRLPTHTHTSPGRRGRAACESAQERLPMVVSVCVAMSICRVVTWSIESNARRRRG